MWLPECSALRADISLWARKVCQAPSFLSESVRERVTYRKSSMLTRSDHINHVGKQVPIGPLYLYLQLSNC